MAEAEVIDLGADPVAERRAARRRATRGIAPIAAAVLLILSVIGLVVAGYESNRRGALALSNDVLDSLEKRIALRAGNWLGEAETALQLLHGVFADGVLVGATREDAERRAGNLLQRGPAIALVSLADTRGNYVLKRRNDSGGIDTKSIRNDPPPRLVTWVRRDADGTVTGTEEDPADTFDPRRRPWFIAAAAAPGVIWTEPYIFFTDRVPGVTAAFGYRRGGELRAVFGVDIRLDALGEFLSRLEIGQSGRAIIIDRAGFIVAHPDSRQAICEEGAALIRTRLDELGDPVLRRALDLYRVNGHGRFTAAVGGKTQIVIWAPLRDVGDGTWSILVTAPEDDFVGFVETTGRITTGVGLVVALVALGLAALLVRQGLRADGMERTLERRTQVMSAQVQALLRLGRSTAVHDPARDEGIELLTVTLAHTLRARRASVWRVGTSGESLRCADIYDTASEAHGRGVRLPRAEHQALFSAALRGEVFEAADAKADPRTASLAGTLLAEVGTRSVMCIPGMRGATLVGLLLVADRQAGPLPLAEAAGFGLAIASIAVSRLTVAETARQAARAFTADATARRAGGGGPVAFLPPPPAAPRLGDGSLAEDRTPEATAPGTDAPRPRGPLRERGLAAEVFPAVTVLVLRLAEGDALAERVAEAGGCTLADRAVQLAQEAASQHGIAYLRVMGGSVMLADGFGDRADDAAAALALLALELAEKCTQLFASLDLAPGFGLGLDTAPAVGAAVGTGLRTYNMWGEAVRGAQAMAASAPPGAVQVTEAVQRRTAERFVFRPRGRFWIPGTGEAATFLLAGRA